MAQKNSMAVIFGVVGVLVLAGGGLVYYFSLPATVSDSMPVAVTKTNTPGVVNAPAASPVASPAAQSPSAPAANAPRAATANPAPRPAGLPTAPPAISAADQQAITDDLQSADPATQTKALNQLKDMAASDARSLAIGMPKWAAPLLATKKYDEVGALGLPAILGRSFDPTPVQAAQRLRVVALMEQGKYADALPQAKSYYNVVTLQPSPDAVNLLATILTHTSSAAAAADFIKQQTSADAAAATAQQPTGALAAIKIDSSQYDDTLSALQGQVGSKGASYSNLMGQGDLLLLSDHPADARKCFESAVKVAGAKTKAIREALEGVARSVRAQTGSISAANTFIATAAVDATTVAAMAGNPAPTTDDISTAARNTRQADLSEILPAK